MAVQDGGMNDFVEKNRLQGRMKAMPWSGAKPSGKARQAVRPPPAR